MWGLREWVKYGISVTRVRLSFTEAVGAVVILKRSGNYEDLLTSKHIHPVE